MHQINSLEYSDVLEKVEQILKWVPLTDTIMSVTGRNGLSSGEIFFSCSHRLTVSNILFEHKVIQWTSYWSTLGTKSVIDFVIVSSNLRPVVNLNMFWKLA